MFFRFLELQGSKDGAVVRFLDAASYRKVSIVSPGLIFVQKAVLLGLVLGELIIREAYYWKEFCVSKWVGLDNKNSLKHLVYENSLKHLKTDSTNSRWAYIREGLLPEGFLHLRIGGIILGGGGVNFGGAYYWNFTVCGLSLLLVLSLLREVFCWVVRFSPLLKK